MSFEIEKKNALTKLDKSDEGKWDDKIRPLCELINKNDDFYTSSSCSGRITIIKSTDQKEEDIFLFKSHEPKWVEDILSIFSNIKEGEIVYFKMEACVLHVACKNFEDAQNLVRNARSVGWKRSGIISSKDKFVCELGSTENISVPLTKDLCKNKGYMETLFSEANKKLERTQEKISKLIFLLDHQK